MIAKKYRLREYEVSRVFKKGRPVFWKYWTVNIWEWRGKNHRMAVSISRKHDKRAVMRNKYRRKMYDTLLPSLKESTEYKVWGIKTDTVSDLVTENQKLSSRPWGVLRPSNGKTVNCLQCVFTLKKWLKLEDVIPQIWLDEAVQIFLKYKKS